MNKLENMVGELHVAVCGKLGVQESIKDIREHIRTTDGKVADLRERTADLEGTRRFAKWISAIVVSIMGAVYSVSRFFTGLG
jgi:hypothetical protein